ncbi:diguanylate cyclase [Desulfovibrio sp.]|uniref:sensor domain-containing diguanylate cyclase n=1 Tax=Desulfovibrio sp. TaxID=885 RepID=UPI0025C18CAF|nr:diguanylate cyclase [Desulfovibrio sp.]
MVKSSKTFIAIVVLAMLFTALLVVVREYTVETTRHLSQDITTRLAEVSLRVADDFEHSLENKLTELQGITGFLAKEDCLPRKDCVLHYAPLLRAAGLKRFAIISPDGQGFCSMTGLSIDIERNSKKSLFERALAGTANIAAVPDGKGSKLAVALPIQRNKEIVAVLIGELEDDPMKKSLFTRAFGDKTCNMVFDGNGRLLFSAAPPGSLDRLFPQMAEKGLPVSLREHLLTIFDTTHGPDCPRKTDCLIKDDHHSYYVTHVPLQQYGWQVVSLLPEEVVNHLVDRQNDITTTLAWRLSILAGLLLILTIGVMQSYHRTIHRQQEDYRSIIASISGGVIKFGGLHGTFQFISPNFLKMLGYRKDEFEQRFGKDFALSIFEPDRENALRTMQQQLEAGIPIDVEYRTSAKNGSLIWLYHKGSPVQAGPGQTYIQSIVFDITHNKEAAQAKRISDERYQFILEQHDIIIFEQNLITGNFSCSAKWMQTFGHMFNILEPNPEQGRIPVHADDHALLEDFQRRVHQDMHEHKKQVELRLRDASGLYHWYRIEASSLISAQGKPIYFIGIITDIDRQKTLELRLRTQATRDSATGMYNKRATEQAISRFLSLHNGTNVGIYAMFMIDFDNFKSINDRFGHTVGDKAIYQMAQIIRRNFRGSDIVGRVGGDEFLVFCTETMPLSKIHERAATLVRQLRLHCGQGPDDQPLTASVGVSCHPTDGHDFSELYKHADMATYEAKRRGRNQCVFYAELSAGEQKNAYDSLFPEEQ